MRNFDEAISGLDLRLFEKIGTQTTDDDKRTLLACQLALREMRPGYSYLEIGSYLGGSIQPHLADEKCARIYSIDRRPEVQPDARGYDWVYKNNSTARMLELLKEVGGDMSKITTIDGDTAAIRPEQVSEKIDLCFIDGEHTDEACFRDFRFCLDVLNENGAILFHDAQITYNGIREATRFLEKSGRRFRAYPLPSVAFLVELGDFPMHRHPAIHEQIMNGHRSYLESLAYNDNFRRFATRFPFGAIRRTLIRVRGGNVSN
jgi:predicted O-methyltransferase YrrM